MASKIKTIIIAAVVVIAIILAYIFLFKKAPDQASLTSSTPTATSTTTTTPTNTTVDTEFVSVLLSVKNIKLNDAIFSNIAFANLRDSSITLTPDGTEGRKNPFAPIGTDVTATQNNSSLSAQTPTATTTTGATSPTATTGDSLKALPKN